ncbi:EamA family transporter [bacterium]|jgi:drug/metabolite transporter (DMT)-like permease|nr:EamA family transporter [bacterium]MBT4292695.1 EamA family transporter [bacterium]
MIYLIIASLIWAFSFGLIKTQLASLDPIAVSSVRLLLAVLVFTPFILRNNMQNRLQFMALGAVQFGLMYVFYITSYKHLPAYAVALFTIFTPLYVALLDDLMNRKINIDRIVAVTIAIIGAGIAVWHALPQREAVVGILLLQVSNICFAVGQYYYRRLHSTADHSTKVGWMYLGATVVVTLLALVTGGFADFQVTKTSAMTLLYLGVIPTGLCFWLWNRGAVKTSVSRLAISNNLKIPVAIIVAWMFFGESAPYLRVGLGIAVIIFALVISNRKYTKIV